MARDIEVISLTADTGRRYFVNPKTLQCFWQIDADELSEKFIDDAYDAHSIYYFDMDNEEHIAMDLDYVQSLFKNDDLHTSSVIDIKNKLYDSLNEINAKNNVTREGSW